MGTVIEGVRIKALQRFPDHRGAVMHIMKSTDEEFCGFGEVYCSTVYPGMVKAWHMSHNTVRHYVVLKGMVKIVLVDDRENSATRGVVQEIFAGNLNYVRVTIPAGVWSGFQCIGNETAYVCDVTDKPHEENRSQRCGPEDNVVPYRWEQNS